MKKGIALAVTMILWFGCKIYAQEGIYLSASDYLNNNLTYKSSEGNRIKLHTDFYKPYIQILKGNSIIKLNKDSVFGYRDDRQNDFRFNKEDERVYRIVENKAVVTYIAYIPVLTPKGNAVQLVPEYFYSNTLTSPIIPLVTNNKQTK